MDSFLLPNNVPLYGCTVFSLSIHQLMDIWVVSTLTTMSSVLWTFLYKSLCRCVFPILSSRYPGTELLGHRITPWLTFWESAKLFPEVAAPFFLPLDNVLRVSVWPHPCHCLLEPFIMSILMHMQLYLIVVFIFISLIAKCFKESYSCMLSYRYFQI
jgi:hypothetical protein